MRAGYDGWGRAALMMVQGTPRALVAVKVRADFMPDGEIVPLLFRPEQEKARRPGCAGCACDAVYRAVRGICV